MHNLIKGTSFSVADLVALSFAPPAASLPPLTLTTLTTLAPTLTPETEAAGTPAHEVAPAPAAVPSLPASLFPQAAASKLLPPQMLLSGTCLDRYVTIEALGVLLRGALGRLLADKERARLDLEAASAVCSGGVSAISSGGFIEVETAREPDVVTAHWQISDVQIREVHSALDAAEQNVQGMVSLRQVLAGLDPTASLAAFRPVLLANGVMRTGVEPTV